MIDVTDVVEVAEIDEDDELTGEASGLCPDEANSATKRQSTTKESARLLAFKTVSQ
jgi:hypothetical protein